MKSHKAIFLSMHGGGDHRDPVSGRSSSLGLVLCYVMPIKQTDSSLISQFPESPIYPKFYNFGSILKQMTQSDIKIHPYTREMLSSLDHWLREQHAVPGAINSLFAPSVLSRIKLFVSNPSYTSPQLETGQLPPQTPNQSFACGPTPLVSSTPASGTGEGDTVHTCKDDVSVEDSQPVDMIVENPIFGSGLRLRRVDTFVVNEYFGCGEPKYDALKTTKGKWVLQVQSDGLPDWTELFPLHKFCCEGDVEGVRKCIGMGMSADERDTDTWSPLHYACWYGELQVIKALVEEASATIGIQNSSGSTPLHLAAGMGHVGVVSYLLQQRGGQGVKAALDNDGKSPLAVCLDSKMNDWAKTAEILRDAYNNPTSADLSFPPPLLPYLPSLEEDLVGGKQAEDLSLKGSLANLDADKPAKKKSKVPGAKVRTIRRQRVNFGIGRYQVAHFFNGKETGCRDIITNIYKLMKLPKNFHTLFSLWIASHSLELQLGDVDQPLKLLYYWKKLLSQYGSAKGEAELPTLYLWRNVFFPTSAEQKIDDSLVLELLYADAHRHVIKSQYPCSEDDIFYLAGITLQLMYGDYAEVMQGPGFLRDKLKQVLPSHMMSSKRKLEFERKILAKYAEMSQHGFDDSKFLYETYLKHCRKWPYYGATFYEGLLHMRETKLEIRGKPPRKSQLPVSIGINTNGFHLVNSEANNLLASIPFDGLDWDVATAKQELVVFNVNKSIYIPIHSKKAPLLYSLMTRMKEQYTKVT